MAINLSAVFRVRDLGSAQLSRLTRNMQQTTRVTQQIASATDAYNTSNGRLRNSLSQFVSQASNANSATTRFSTSVSGLQGSSHSATSSLSGLHRALIGIAGAYLSVQAGKSAFDATIGAAARLEQQEVITRTMFQDDGKAAEYSKMIKQLALDSAVLNSTDMATGSKAFVGLTKDLGQLQDIWKITEKLQAFSGVDTGQASFSFKELLQGDALSIVEAIGMDKKSMQSIAKLGTVEQKIAAITGQLDKMGVTDRTLEEMSKTTLGRWSAITEKVQSFFTAIGEAPNGRLNDYLAIIQDKLEGINAVDLANKIGGGITKAFNTAANAIAFIKGNLDEFKGVLGFVKESVIALTAAFVAHKVILGGFVLYKTIATFMTVYRTSLSLVTAAQAAFNTTLFANPIGLIIGAIAALIGITVYLIRNWETVTATAERVWAAIGGGSGAIALVLGPIGFLINAGVDLAKNWDSTKSIWDNVWSSIQRSAATSVNAVIGLINSLIETINKIPGIEIGTIGKVDWGNTQSPIASYSMPTNSSSGIAHSHYHGIDNIPYDGYNIRAHKNERLLTAQENKEYSQGGGSSAPVINIAKMEVRKESDIEQIAFKLAKLIEQEGFRRGHSFT